MFGSVDEEDQPELETKPEDQKPMPKLSNGTLANGTSSPDSGHPSSRNFSTTSGLSDYSPSTDEASAHDSGARAGASQTSSKKLEPAAEEVPPSVANSQPRASQPESELTKLHPSEQEVKGEKGDRAAEKVDSKKASVVSEEASERDTVKEDTGVQENEPAAPVASEQDNKAQAMETDPKASPLESRPTECSLSDQDMKMAAEKVDSRKGNVVSEEASERVIDKEDMGVRENDPAAPMASEQENTALTMESDSKASPLESEPTTSNQSDHDLKGPSEKVDSKKAEEVSKEAAGNVSVKTNTGILENEPAATVASEQDRIATAMDLDSDVASERNSLESGVPLSDTDPKCSELQKQDGDSEGKVEGGPQETEARTEIGEIDSEVQKMQGTEKDEEKVQGHSEEKPDSTQENTITPAQNQESESCRVETQTLKTADKKSPEMEKTVKGTQSTEEMIHRSESLNKERTETLSDKAPGTSKDKSESAGTDGVVNNPQRTEESEDPQKEEAKTAEPPISQSPKPEEPAISTKADGSSVSQGISSTEAAEDTAGLAFELKQPGSSPTQEVNLSVMSENAVQSVSESKQEEPSNEVKSSETVQNADKLESHSKEGEPSSVKESISSEPTESNVQKGSESKPEVSSTKETTSAEVVEETVPHGSDTEDAVPVGERITVSDSEDVKASPQGLSWMLERRDSNTESEGCVSAPPLLTQQSSTLDLADSDDSPSALEMEDIPTALICMSSEDHWAKQPPLTLDAPSALRTPREPGVDMPVLELRLEMGPNTSPEATESILSEEDPDMDSLFPKADSLAVKGELKNELASPVSSIGTTYSVSANLLTKTHIFDLQQQAVNRFCWSGFR